MSFGILSTFECPEQNVEWEDTEEQGDGDAPTRLVGSGKTLFDVETDHGWIELWESNVAMWDWDEMGSFTFQGIGKLGDKWLVLNADQLGKKVTDQDGVEHEIKSIKVVDPNGCHKKFVQFLDYMKFLGKMNKSVKKTAKEHNLDISGFYNVYMSDEEDEEDEDDSSSEEENQTTQPEEIHEEEKKVLLKEMNWEETAKFMFQEILDRTKIVELNKQIKEQIELVGKALQKEDWDEAIRVAALVRPLFRFCPYTEEAQDHVWKCTRKIIGDDLCHVKTFDDMMDLVKSHKYMKVCILPKELLGNQRRLADSKLNVLYVSQRVEKQFRNVHATLEVLVDESKDMEDGKKVQIDLDMKRILKSSYIPNQLIYKIRGFKNFDMMVNVW